MDKNSEQSMLPRQIILTYTNDPCTTVTIRWRTDSEFAYAKLLFCQDPTLPLESWRQVSGTVDVSKTLPGAWIHSADLTSLEPGEEYTVAFVSGDEILDAFSFRTVPDCGQEIVFLMGADSHIWPPGSDSEPRRKANAFAAKYDPDFILLAGDLWYANDGYDRDFGKGTTISNVERWFNEWHELMVTPSGRRIPLVPAQGNHDCGFYNDLFRLADQKSNYVLQFGPDLTLITLGYSVNGAATEWLERTLEEYQDSTWLLVQHHPSPYPGRLPFDEPYYGSTWVMDIRKDWVPLYEKYGVDMVLAGHCHSCIKTHPIKENAIDPSGVVYLVAG